MTEAERNLAQLQATLDRMAIDAMNSTPDQLADLPRRSAEVRAIFDKFTILHYETWGAHRQAEAAEWQIWERTFRLSQFTPYELDDPY